MKNSIWVLTSALPLLAAGAAAQVNPPHQPPSEIKGDLEPGETPQSAEDLRRSRDLAYGRNLTVTQHEEILSWRTESPSWWTAPERAAIAHARNDGIAALIRDTPEESLKDVFDASDVTFGLEMHDESLAWSDSPAKRNTAVVTVEVAKRPDLFPLVTPILDFATEYWDAEEKEKAAYFAQILEHALKCEVAVVAEEVGCGQYLDTELLAARTQLEETFDRELTVLANEGSLAIEVEVLAVREAYLGPNSALYDESAHRQFLGGIETGTRAAEEATANAILAGVPDLLRTGLLELIVELHRSTTISRAYLTETGAAAFLDATQSVLELEGGQ